MPRETKRQKRGRGNRNKGVRNEQMACDVMRPIAPDCKRNFGQSRARGEVPDIGPVPGFWVEVGAGGVNPRVKYEQACEEKAAHLTTEKQEPIALTRRTDGPLRHRRWLVTLDADAFTELVRKAPTMPAGMNVDLDDTIALLRQQQAARCCYGTKDGDGKRCDCKFGRHLALRHLGEATGCPEMRAALRVLLALKAAS